MCLVQCWLSLTHPGEGTFYLHIHFPGMHVGPPNVLWISQVLSWCLPQVSLASSGALLSMYLWQVIGWLPYLSTLAPGACESSHTSHIPKGLISTQSVKTAHCGRENTRFVLSWVALAQRGKQLKCPCEQKTRKNLVYWTADSLNARGSETLRLKGKKRLGWTDKIKLLLLQWKNRRRWCDTPVLQLTWETCKMPILYKKCCEWTHCGTWEGEGVAAHSVLQASECLVTVSSKQSIICYQVL